MEKTNNQIDNTNTKSLSIQVALNGLSFCITNNQNQQIEHYNEVFFEFFEKARTIEENLIDFFATHENLNQKFQEVKVLHYNMLYELVPDEMFDRNYLASYLQYSSKVYEHDFLEHDNISDLKLNNVFIPNIRVNNFLLEQFGTFNYSHGLSILVKKCYNIHELNNNNKCFLNINEHQIDIIIFEENKLQICNSFEVQTPTDILYYVLFTFEQLKINPLESTILLLGNINEFDPNFKLLKEYIKSVEFAPLLTLKNKNYFSDSINRKHFILFEA